MSPKKRPLSQSAKAALEAIFRQTQPRQEFNPGVVDRLMRDGLVDVVLRRSPYRSHRDRRMIEHLEVTAAGKDLVNGVSR